MKVHNLYIGLGSNLGDRFELVQSAIDLMFKYIGDVVKQSSIYETPSVGFDGPPFFNACCQVSTFLSAEESLEQLQRIEHELGRTQKSLEGYTSRTIDLDILFYNQDIISTAALSIPHPRLHNRRFVLEPLHELQTEVVHPKLQKTISSLLIHCKDNSVIAKRDEQLINPKSRFNFNRLNYLAIEGNIGSGKTSLTTLIAQEFNGRLVLERFADNPFLPKFYEDPDRYAFTLEMSFLADRYQQITEDLGQFNLFKDFVVSDYYVYKSLIFSKITLPSEEFKLYRTLFYQMFKDLPRPDRYIYLYQNTKRLKQNIKKRGREYEQTISVDYLESIQKGYLEFLKNQSHLKVEIIDITERDFIKNREDYVWILNEIERCYTH